MLDMAKVEFSPATVDLYQSNEITVARYTMTATQKNIIYAIMSKFNRDVETSITIDINELIELTGVSKKHISRLYKSIRELQQIVFEIDNKQQHIITSFITTTIHDKDSGEITFKLSPEIQQYFFGLYNNFTVYQLDYVLNLKSFFSKRCYELLSLHRNLNKPCIYTVEQLKDMFKLENKYSNYTMFKYKVLDTAQKELKNKTDISFTYNEIKKQGKAIHSIEFIPTYKSIGKQMKLQYTTDINAAESGTDKYIRMTDAYKRHKFTDPEIAYYSKRIPLKVFFTEQKNAQLNISEIKTTVKTVLKSSFDKYIKTLNT